MSRNRLPAMRRNLTRGGQHRLSGDRQAAGILDSACKVMLALGAGGFSVRKVAQDAGVSIGHLQHYFPTRADLLRAMVISLEEEFYDHYEQRIATIGDPVERFVACAQYVLDQGVRDNLMPLMREFWVVAARDEAMAESLSDFYRDCRRFAAHILREANAELTHADARRRSCTAVSLLSGAFLYLEPWNRGEMLQDFHAHLLTIIRRLPFYEPEIAAAMPA